MVADRRLPSQAGASTAGGQEAAKGGSRGTPIADERGVALRELGSGRTRAVEAELG